MIKSSSDSLPENDHSSKELPLKDSAEQRKAANDNKNNSQGNKNEQELFLKDSNLSPRSYKEIKSFKYLRPLLLKHAYNIDKSLVADPNPNIPLPCRASLRGPNKRPSCSLSVFPSNFAVDPVCFTSIKP